MLLCVAIARAEEEKQIKLEDIERDSLLREAERDDLHTQKELAPQPTQHIQLSYSNNPQDVFVTVTPTPNDGSHSHYTVKGTVQERVKL
jgi:hypothetical protein